MSKGLEKVQSAQAPPIRAMRALASVPQAESGVGLEQPISVEGRSGRATSPPQPARQARSALPASAVPELEWEAPETEGAAEQAAAVAMVQAAQVLPEPAKATLPVAGLLLCPE